MRLAAFCLASIGMAAGFVAAVPAASANEFLQSQPGYSHVADLREDASLHAIAFVDSSRGIAVGDRGTILFSDDGGERWQPRESGVDCRLDDLIWLDERHVVVVGGNYDPTTGLSRGVVLHSGDGGDSWQPIDDSHLPRLYRVRLAPSGRRLIALGDWSPTAHTRGFVSDDGGQQWRGTQPAAELVSLAVEPSPTTRAAWTSAAGAESAVRGRCRADEKMLFAVGDHGLIIKSPDEGQSWRIVRGHERKTTVLMIAQSAATTGWPLIGQEALERGHRVALLLIDSAPSDRTVGSELDRARQATVTLGGAAADVVGVLEQRSATNLASDPALSPQPTMAAAAGNHVEQLQHWLAMHRPNVVVLDATIDDAVRQTMERLAIRRGVERIMTYQFDGRGESMLHANALLPRAGVLARDLWDDALQLVEPAKQPAGHLSLTTVYDSSAARTRGDSVADGLLVSPGGRLSARLEPASRRRTQIARARLSEPARIDRLFAHRVNQHSFRGSLVSLLEQTAAEDRDRLIRAVWHQACSRQDLRAETIVLDVCHQTMPSSSLGAWAGLRAEAIASSSEWAQLRETVAGPDVETLGATELTTDVVQVSPFQLPLSSPDTPSFGGVMQASATAPMPTTQHHVGQLAEPSVALAGGAVSPPAGARERQRDVDLTWEFHPAVLVARDAARRHVRQNGAGLDDGPSANLKRLASSHDQPGWQRLVISDGPHALIARRAASPPKLDDSHADRCWTTSMRKEILIRANQPTASAVTQPDPTTAATLQATYDDDYLYLAIRCPVGMISPASAAGDTERRRDADLSAQDHLQLLIDTDRDLQSAMELAVTSDGRTHDSIDGHDRWQPTWYVAPSSHDTHYSFELAILQRDLTAAPIHAGESWYLSLRLIRAGEAAVRDPLPTADQWFRVEFK